MNFTEWKYCTREIKRKSERERENGGERKKLKLVVQIFF